MANSDVKEISRSTFGATDANRLEAIELVFKELEKLDKETIEGLVIGVSTKDGAGFGTAAEKPLFISFVGDSPCVAMLLKATTMQYLRTVIKETKEDIAD